MSHGTSKDNNRSSVNKLDFVSNLAYSEIRVLRILDSNKFGSFSGGDDHIMQSPVCFGLLSGHFLLILCDKCLAEVLLVGLIVTLVGILPTLGVMAIGMGFLGMRVFTFFMVCSIGVSFFSSWALRWLL